METNINIVPEIWGQEAFAKKQAHYSRLRANQAKQKVKKHLKRLKQMGAVKSRLAELGVPWVPNPMFDARYKFEVDCVHAANNAYYQLLKHTPEVQLEIQRGFKKLPLSAV